MELPYLKVVRFEYEVKTTDVLNSASVVDTFTEEIYAPTFMDVEWYIRCYLLEFKVKNTAAFTHELMSIRVLGSVAEFQYYPEEEVYESSPTEIIEDESVILEEPPEADAVYL